MKLETQLKNLENSLQYQKQLTKVKTPQQKYIQYDNVNDFTTEELIDIFKSAETFCFRKEPYADYNEVVLEIWISETPEETQVRLNGVNVKISEIKNQIQDIKKKIVERDLAISNRDNSPEYQEYLKIQSELKEKEKSLKKSGLL